MAPVALIDSSMQFAPSGHRLIVTGQPGLSLRSGTMNRAGTALTKPARPSVGLHLFSTYQCAGGL